MLIFNLGISAFAAPTTKTDKIKDYIYDWFNEEETEKYFAEISDAIWSYAELGLEEYHTADLIQYAMEKEGFKIDRGVADMPTALPLITQNAWETEHDAIVKGGPGHGCTHNTMATAGAATTIAVKKAMEKFGINGTVRYYGSPAEETLISRPYFIEAGLFDDVDIIIDNHVGNGLGTSWYQSLNHVLKD